VGIAHGHDGRCFSWKTGRKEQKGDPRLLREYHIFAESTDGHRQPAAGKAMVKVFHPSWEQKLANW
jgi:hypothetical protein